MLYIPNGINNSYLEENYVLTGYINDINTRYTQVLMEYGVNGAYNSVYEYGLQRTSMYQNGQVYSYEYDGRGSVSELVNAIGETQIKYSYGAYGETISTVIGWNNPVTNPYCYNAERIDDVAGVPAFQYLRARYLNPYTASFLTRDTYEGQPNVPLSQNRYAYAHNNPVMYTDPSGNAIETVVDVISAVDSAYNMWKNPSWGNAGFLAWDLASIAGPFVPGSWIIKGADKAHDGINTVKKLKLVEKVSSYFDEAVEYSVKKIKKSVTAVGPHVGKIKKGADMAIRLPYAAFKVVDNKIDDALIKSGRYLSGKVDEAARYIKSAFCHGEDVTEAVTKKADEIAEAVQEDSGMLDNILEEAVDDKPDISNNGGGSPDPAPDPGNGTPSDNMPDGDNENKPKGEADSTASTIAKVDVDSLPQNVQDAFEKYDKAGWKGNVSGQTPGTCAGRTWDNRNNQLPSFDANGNPITYREFDVNNYNGTQRDTERFVVGTDDSIWYTDSHYGDSASLNNIGDFVQIR